MNKSILKFLRSSAVISLCLAISACSNEDDIRSEIRCLDDIDGKTVCVMGGSVQDLLLTKTCPNSNILRVDSATDSYNMVETGKACACIVSSIAWDSAKDGFHNIVEVGQGIAPKPIGIAFNKNSDDLRFEFNKFLSDFMAENDINAIMEDWENPETDRKMPDPADYDCSNGHLDIAVSAIHIPFNFIKNGEVCGVESELLARFAISQHKSWEFVDIVFSGLIAALQSGKVDIAASIMCITPERLQSVNFSDPWFSESSLIIVNKNYAPEELLGNLENDDLSFFESLKESFQKTLIKEDRYLMLLQGLETTVIISLLAAVFGALLGMLICLAAMSKRKILSALADGYIEFMRCMPQVVFLMIMFYIVFAKSDMDGIWVATIAFALCFAAYTSVIFRSAVESIDKGQREAALSLGFSRFDAFRFIIFPQAVQRALPVFKSEFISLVKATSIVGYIAVFDLTKAGDIIRSRTYEAFFPLIIVTILYFIIIKLLSLLIKYIEIKTKPKRNKYIK